MKKRTARKNSAISFIYFDMGGVLVRWRGALAKISQISGKSEQQVMSVFQMHSDEACRGTYSAEELWGIYHEALDLSKSDAQDFGELWSAGFTSIAETHSLVHELKAGHRLGILSNIEPGVFTHVQTKGHIPEVTWDVVIKSCDIGMIKPEPQIFALAQKQAGVEASQILLIDDRVDNVNEAKKQGWQSVVFNENQPLKSIAEIKRLLK